jgi:Flp pilus assembly protein TadG
MARQSTQSRIASESGTVALEYGFLLPVLIALFLGSMDVSRLIWTYTTLHRAVEAAARCGAVNQTICGNTTQVQSRAVSETWGITVSPSVFTVTMTDTTVAVTANYDFTIVVPFMGDLLTQGEHRITVSAQFPMKR